MNAPDTLHTITRRAWACALLALASTALQAHDTRAGDVVIDHAYATPSPAGSLSGAVYFRALRNEGRQAERLLGARTPIAERVEIRRGTDLQPSIALPAGSELKLRHDGDTRLALVGLQQPLKDGDRFELRLRFERAGERALTVWVQQPRAARETARY